MSSRVTTVGGWSSTVVLNQDSGIKSLNISQMLCKIQQEVTTCGTLVTFIPFLFVNLRHLAFSHPNTFSTTIRECDRVYLNFFVEVVKKCYVQMAL